MKRSRTLVLVLVVTPLLLVAFAMVLYALHSQSAVVREENANLQAKVAAVEEERDFYKEQYENTVEDVNALARIEGVGSRYAVLAQELREQEVSELVKAVINKTHYLRNEHLWQQYAASDIIDLSCLTPQTVDTKADVVLITIDATKANYSIYLDGNFLEQLTWHGQLSVEIPSGMHELDITSREQATIHNISFDTVAVNMSNAVVDYGGAWQAYDCENALQGTRLDEPGAVRILFEKA